MCALLKIHKFLSFLRLFRQERDGGGGGDCSGSLLHLSCGMRTGDSSTSGKQQENHGIPSEIWLRQW